MFAIKDRHFKTHSQISDDITLLRCTRKSRYTKLSKNQKKKRVVIQKPNSDIIYEYEFKLGLDHVSKSHMYLYEKNLNNIPKGYPLLWVCSVKKSRRDIEYFNLKDLDWHFSVVESKLEMTSKHKGIISHLTPDDGIIFAGEMYIHAVDILWNDTTGTVKSLLHYNSEQLGYDCRRVLENILTQFGSCKYVDDLVERFATDINYKYVNDIYEKGQFVTATRRIVDNH